VKSSPALQSGSPTAAFSTLSPPRNGNTRRTPCLSQEPNSLTEELSNQAARTTWPGLLSRGDTSPKTILYLLLMAE